MGGKPPFIGSGRRQPENGPMQTARDRFSGLQGANCAPAAVIML
nr:hypothetical protein [uncultured Agathobaculum sp.]